MTVFVKMILGVLFSIVLTATTFAQLQPVHVYWQDDTIIKHHFYTQALKNNNFLISSLGKEYKKDYESIYKERFEEVGKMLKSNRIITAPEAHPYLQEVLRNITDANPELKELQIRLVFSRDWWPNAYSMGEGTLVVNAGLMTFLANEAELAFVLCHELAHFYLDHSNKMIRKSVELVNSDAFKAEVKRISKEEYRVGQQLETLLKPLVFDKRRHSRENEAEADRQAFRFLKKTRYDIRAIRSCLELLDKVDDSLLYKPVNVEQVFHFAEYPFKKKWIQKESAIFSQVTKDESPLSKKEKDSLKTHPDCLKRISLLTDSIQSVPASGKLFLVDEKIFQQLKKDLIFEIAEYNFKEESLGRHLYYSLLMLQQEETAPAGIYSIARCLNLIYKKQKEHTLGMAIGTENRTLREDYNLLLRMISRLRLDEIASLSYYFCRQYEPKMAAYTGFAEEMKKAQQLKEQSPF